MSGAAARRHHEKFCRIEGWVEPRNTRNKKVGHHLTFELTLPDGGVLRTRISRPANNETYGPALWSHILRDQLCVTETEFWSCVDQGIAPGRSRPASPPTNALPADLVYQLLHTVGFTEEYVATLDRDTAIKLMNEHWSK